MSGRRLYEEVGGAPAVGALVDELYARLAVDDLVGHLFTPDRLVTLKASQRDYFGQLLGGPEVYRGPDLAKAHSHLAITDEQVQRMLQHLAEAAAAAGVAPDPARRVVALARRLWYAREW